MNEHKKMPALGLSPDYFKGKQIGFELGIAQGRREAILDMEKQVADAYQGGKREVVEFVNFYHFCGGSKEWQAQLKEWGLKP